MESNGCDPWNVVCLSRCRRNCRVKYNIQHEGAEVIKRFLAILALLGLVPLAQATTIVDTGAYNCAGGVGTSCGGSTLFRYNTDYQYLSAKFSLADAAVVSSVEGWMNTFGSIGDTLTIAIYGDGGQIPNVANQLYSQAFSIYAPVSQDGYGNAWQGLSGLGWLLSAGNYWISFEVRSGQDYWGYMPSGTWGAPNPLADEAFQYSGNGATWLQDDGMNIGVRIQGDYVVPVPPTIWLMALGLLGLAIKSRRT